MLSQTTARIILALVSVSCTQMVLAAQEPDGKNLITVGGGGAFPGADLRPYMSSAFLLRLNYAYRFHRNLQAEVGMDALFGAAGVNKIVPSVVGDIKINDDEVFVPFGLRAILPLHHNRFELSAGGGGAYMTYSENASVPEGVTVSCPYGPCYVNVDCPTCKSRGGWGCYGIGGADFAPAARRRAGVGDKGSVVRRGRRTDWQVLTEPVGQARSLRGALSPASAHY